MSHTNNTQKGGTPQAFNRAKRNFFTRQVIFVLFGLAIIALGLFLVLGRGGDQKPKAEAVEDSTAEGLEAVDMGLSVRWASCNVGAKSATMDGDYYAWGETKPLESYDWLNSSTFEKALEGDVLQPANDASTLLGEGWRMPTKAEFEELMTQCDWHVKPRDGGIVYEVTAPNGNSILLPASGHIYNKDILHANIEGFYWCSDILAGGDNRDALILWFNSCDRYIEPLNRFYGAQIRAVRE